MNSLHDKRITVAGLGRFGGGIAVSRWLVEQGARVLVTDTASAEALADSCAQLKGLPIEFHLGGHREQDFTSADLVVASPAIPPADKFLQAAQNAGVPVTTEIRLFIERCPAKIVGITGTKGKSTTTALLGLMLKSRFTTHVGGNIGKSLLFDLPNIKPDHLVVLEISSFMLEYLGPMKWSPHVAVVTMLADDHLDRHGSKEAYLEAKKNLVRFQSPADVAVLGEECPFRTDFSTATSARVILYGLAGRKHFSLKVPGLHNQLNAQAAFAAASAFDVTWDDAQDAIREFAGLPHRLQLVHEHDGIRYFNDSIATIPEAAIAALRAFPPRTVIQIVGGYDKKLPLNAMCGVLVDEARAILCIGQTGPAIASLAGESQRTGRAEVYNCGDLATAVSLARKIARAGDVVLLSPGCASYGQFDNFESRGNTFQQLAAQISEAGRGI